MRMQKQSFFALTAWRLGGASVRRAAMTLAAVLLTTMTAWAYGIATTGSCGDNATYAITGTDGNYTLTISGTGAIGYAEFYSKDLSGIKTVVINEGITSIGDRGFMEQADITSVSLPASLTSIGELAFLDCHSLATVTIASGSQLTTINVNAFENCYFTSIVLPCAGLNFIGEFAFNRSDSYRNLMEIVCLTETGLSVGSQFYNNENQVTVYMLGSQRVNWADAKATKGLVRSIVKGSNVSSLTIDASGAETKTALGTTYYVSGSTVKLTLASSLSGDGVIFRANGTDLTKGSDGKYALTLPDDATTVTVTASIPQNISGATVTLSETSYTYDGSAKTPAVNSVTLGGTTLTADDYTVSYANNMLPGTAIVTVTGKGDYYGTATTTFVINGPAIAGLTFNATDGCYDISTLAELQAFRTYAASVGVYSYSECCQGLTFRLIADIGTSESGVGTLTPIPCFKGTFLGNGNTIYGAVLTDTGTDTDYNFGFFNGLYGNGTVSGLSLDGLTLNCNYAYVGGIVGFCQSRAQYPISDCHIKGATIQGGNSTGGIVGQLETASTLLNCTFSGNINCPNNCHIGGIAGGSRGSISGCTVNESNISGGNSLGGILGQRTAYNSTISDCRVLGTIVSGDDSGIIAGYSPTDAEYHLTISNCIYHNPNGLRVCGFNNGNPIESGNVQVYQLTLGEGVTATGSAATTAGGKSYYTSGTTVTLGNSRPGYAITSYTSSDVTITNGQFTMPANDVEVSATWTDMFGMADGADGTAEHPYVISTTDGWNYFCDALQDNDTWNRFSGKTVKLGANITVSRMAGSSGHEFCGTFDGDSHTLTLAYGTADAPVDAQFVAPFVATSADGSNQPVFRNLTIDGTIYDSYSGSEAHNVGGLIGHLYGDVTIEHCTSNLTITSVGGAGGFVGLCEHTAMFTDCVSSAVITSPGGNNSGFVSWSRASGHAISFEGCVFNGKLLQQNGEGSYNGGFIGWTGSNKTVTITNCLCNPAATTSGETMATSNSATFARGWNATTTAPNSYYTTAFSTVQGEQAYSIKAGGNVTTNGNLLESEAVTIDHAGVPTAYTTSGITAYKATENSSTFIAGLLYNKVLYAGNGDEVSLTLSNTPPDGYGFHSYTTYPDDATISGDANPYTLTMPNADVWIKAMFDPLPITVRYIDEKGHPKTVENALDLSKFDGEIIPEGSVCSFSSEYIAEYTHSIGGDVTIILPDDFELRIGNIDGNHTITFYGQEKGNGKLNVTESIYNNVTVYAGSITVGEESESNVYGTVTVSGGNVHIDGTISRDLQLSWTKPSDSFYAATIRGSVKIPEDKIFYDEDGNDYSGDIDIDETTGTNPIGGKTLRPYNCRLSLSDAASNSTAIENANGLVYNVTLSGRTLYKDGKWNTLCLPFDVTVGSGQMEDATAMTFDGETSGFVASTGVLTLNFVGVDEGRTITAGTPFIVKWTGTDVTNPVFSGVTVSSTTAGSVTSDDKKVQFVGTYSPVDIYSPDHCNLYLGSGNTLYYPEGEDMTSFPINACRAYFHVDSEVQSKVRAFVLNFDEDEATGILSTTDDTDFTDSDDAWYDLSGRKLSGKPSQRGVYIRGGRKIAVQ
ncbi:MAG: leucine-rich repeat protein [Bacteroidaceae bacterium]|nr:leucine-rich repeat protein [Bacteroidaceae bacterium]